MEKITFVSIRFKQFSRFLWISLLTLLFSSPVLAQGEFKINVDLSIDGTFYLPSFANNFTGGSIGSIVVYDQTNLTTPILSFANVHPTTVIDVADFPPASAGVVNAQIWYSSDLSHIFFNSNNATHVAQAPKLQAIVAWGDAVFTSLSLTGADQFDIQQFAGAPNFVSTGISLFRLFKGCTAFEDPFNTLGSWDTANVTNFGEAFFNADAFVSSNLGNWDVGKVVTYTNMFAQTEKFNDPTINNWNIGEQTGTNNITMANMFDDALAFNQPLAGWEDNADSSMEYVVNMGNMFRSAALFNQDIGNWDVGRVTTFFAMFYTDANQATAFNNGDLANAPWDIPLGTGIGLRDWNIGANLSGTDTIDMRFMFGTNRINEANDHFNQDLSNWDVSRVNAFDNMFRFCTVFTGDGADELLPANSGTIPPNETPTSGLSNWKIGDANNNAITMTEMFVHAHLFNEPLNSWETDANSTMGYVTAMNAMFFEARVFNQPLDDWDVGRVTSFNQMFYLARVFNNGDAADAGIDEAGDVGIGMRDWNIGANLAPTATIGMFRMFRQAFEFNQDLSNWDVTQVTNFQEMFWTASDFTGDGGVELTAGADTVTSGLSNWKIGGTNTNAINMQNMFGNAISFNEPLATWETNAGSTTAYVTNMARTFSNADSFNQPLGDWDVGRVVNFAGMFDSNDGFADPAPNINQWNIGQNTAAAAINMEEMFQNTTQFNSPLAGWETNADSSMEYVNNLSFMFDNADAFNQPLGDWDVGRVTDFRATFANTAIFNDPAPSINDWNISENNAPATINMGSMFFRAAAFNKPLEGWQNNADATMEYVTNTANMFREGVFNQPIGDWDVSAVETLNLMFFGASDFDQSLSNWTPIAGINFENTLSGSGLSVANYDATLISWAQQDLVDALILGATGLEFCAAEPFRSNLVTPVVDGGQGWDIQGDDIACAPGSVSSALLYWVSAGSHLGTDGAPVAEWRDLSGDGRVFSQSTAANQPTFLDNTTDMINFNPLMQFDGTDDYLEGFDFNELSDALANANTPRINLPIAGRSASSELSVTTNPTPPALPVTYVFSANNSVLGNNFSGANTPGSWRPSTAPTPNANTTEYLELDLGEIVPLSTIRTRGERANAQPANWVETYTVEVSTDGLVFTQVDGVFTGNVNRTDVVLNEFSQNFSAQYVRIFPQTWNGYPALCVGVGSNSYEGVSTFIVAIEDARQDNTTQSVNHIDMDNRLDISVADGSDNITVTNSLDGDNSVTLSAAAPSLDNESFLIHYVVGGSGEAKLYRNGTEVALDTSVPKYNILGNSYLGGLPTSGYFNGKIAEANLFGTELTQSERERIQTFFAIKYNIPLQHNFIYEDESAVIQTVWDMTANATYNNDVFGLAKDDNQGLNQRVSSSREGDKVLTAATAANFTSLNNDPSRGALAGTSAFVILGNDNGAATFSPNDSPNKFKVLDRKWYAQVTGGDQDIFLEFNVGNTNFDIASTEQTPDYYLVKDDNNNGLLTDDAPIILTNTSGDLWSTPSAITIADGQLFTLAIAFTTYPGGVATDLALWLKANEGISDADGSNITTWEDQSINTRDFTGAANAPDFIETTDNVNFNPYIDFEFTTSDRLNGPNYMLSGPNAPDYQIYFVYNQTEVVTGTFPDLWDWDGVDSEERIEAFGGNFQGSTIAVPAPLGTWNIGVSGTTNNQQSGRVNALSAATTQGYSSLPFDGNGNVSIGTNGQLNANIAEVIYYTSEDTGVDRQKIESYLALKYGITLSQATPTAYLASDGTTKLWDETLNTTYNKDIAGIVRDDNTSLLQKVGRSVNANSIVTMTLDNDLVLPNNDATRTSGFASDLEAMTWANNGAAEAFAASNIPGGTDSDDIDVVLERIWQVQERGDVAGASGNLYIAFDLDNIPITGGTPVATDLYLLISNSDDFTGLTNANSTNTGTIVGNQVVFAVAEADLETGQFFTLGSVYNGTLNTSPGGVSTDLTLWIKANEGTGASNDGDPVTTWIEYSAGDVSVTSNGTEPTFEDDANSLANFNPSIQFNGAGDFTVNDGHKISETDAFTIYTVVSLDSGTGTLLGAEQQQAGGSGFIWHDDGYLIHETSEGDVINGTIVTRDAIPHIGLFERDGIVNTKIVVDGQLDINAAVTNSFLAYPTYRIGSNGGVAFFSGKINEVIIFDKSQSDSIDEQKIQSYLAIKYGITLNSGTVAYKAVDGTDVWTADTTYASDIFGIANEEAQALDQQISKSVNTGAILTVSTDTDFSTANGTHTSLTDGQFLLIGNDGGSGAVPTTANATDLNTNLYFNRSTREWKSMNTGMVGTVHLQFDGYDENWVLLTRTADGDFSATTGTTETALSSAGTVAVTLAGTTYFTLAQKLISVEFEATTASDVEATGGNLPNLLIDGNLTMDATIDVVINASGTATAGTDFALGSASGDGAVTLSGIIPAGSYSAANPVPLAGTLVDDVSLDVNYASMVNPPAVFQQETFVPAVTGDYVLKHTAATVNSGDGWVNIGTSLLPGTGATDIFDGENGGDRIDATTPSKSYTISLTTGTTYYLTTGAGANSDLDNVSILITHPIDFSITDDNLVEADETTSLTLSNPQNGLELKEITGGSLIDTHLYTITDDDTATVTIAADADADETTASRAFTLTMSAAASTDVEVSYTLSGTAADPADYDDSTTVAGTVTIPAGSTTATIDLTVVNDTQVELTETVIATLTAATNNTAVTASTTPATLNITDDDASALMLSIDSPTNATEGSSNISYVVRMDNGLTNNTGSAITGTIALTGTATNGTDYADVTAFSIADGASFATVAVTVANDAQVEVTETVVATISTPSVGAINTSASNVSADIIDDDSTALTLSIASPVNATEGSSDISYTVSLDGGVTNNTGSAITGTIALTGTATNGTDYADLSSFSIADGASLATITVSVTNDTQVELTETVIATISAPSVGTINATASNASADIVDDDAVALMLSIGSPVDGLEGGTNITYTVSMDGGLSNSTGSPITGVLTLSGTAANGTDYTNLTTFAIADGASAGTITVNITDDTQVEIAETVVATISSPSVGAINTAADNASAFIADDDISALTLSIDSPVNGTEGSTDISFTVSLDGGLTNHTGSPITGTVVLTGTATNGTDYTDVTTFSIADGSSTGTITAMVANDTQVEITETVIATISDPNVGTVNTASATANILDDDAAALVLSIGSPVNATEGSADIAYTVSMDGGLTNYTGLPITGTVALTGTATNGADYMDITTFSIADGASSALVTVTVTDDTHVEITETVVATISAPSLGTINTAASSATADIIDDDITALILSIGNAVSGTEGSSDIDYTVNMEAGLTNHTGSPIMGIIALTGTATNGTDYTDVTTFSIADGASSATVTVSITDDAQVEITETVIATIAAPSAGTISTTNGSASADIIDDDAVALTLSIGSPVNATEGSSDISYTVSLDGGVTNNTGSPITGTLALSGTATNGTDYVDVTTFSIADGASAATVTISVNDDTQVEVTETVVATISAPSLGAINATATSASADIMDDDAAALTLSIGSPVNATEGSSDISYTVSLDGGVTNNTGSPITGTIALTGTATNGADYTDVTTFSIADGARSAVVVVAVTNDTQVELTETVIATISAPSVGAVNATASSATADIIDDDITALVLSIGNAVSGTEGSSDISYTVSMEAGLTNHTGSPITGTIALTGTAVNGTDYTDVTTFAIADGASSTIVMVSVTDDTLVEITETVIATIAAPSAGNISATNSSAAADIIDDDATALTVSIASPINSTEGSSDISYTVSLDNGLTNNMGSPITGTIALTGTAVNGTDYTDVTTFAIADGASSTIVMVSVTDDTLVEITETVIATIAAPSVGTVNATSDSATADILDDDAAALTLSIANPIDGTEGGPDIGFTVSLDGGVLNSTGAPITGTLVLTGTATNGTDYTDVVTFAIADGASSAMITIVPISDNEVETTETVIATLSAPSIGVINTSSGSTTANLLDNTTAIVTLVADVDAAEGAAGQRNFTLLMSNPSATPTEVNYTLGGTALNPQDYTDGTAVSGTVTIPAGATTANLVLDVVDDTMVEVSETIVATLLAATNNSAITADATPATLTILDDDQVTVAITADSDAEETTMSREFTVNLAQVSDIDVVVTYSLSGTATASEDYVDTTAGSITIPAGRTTGTIVISALDDFLVEGDETVVLTPSSSSSFVTFAQPSIVLVILDDDSCDAPLSPMVDNIQIRRVDLSWSAPMDLIVEGYLWSVFESGADPLTASAVVSGNTMANVTSAANVGVFAKDTTYDFYVQTICSSTSVSPYSTKVTFTTLPDNDNDGIPDGIDPDDDNDGISDLEEGNGDCDNDGIQDSFDPDPCGIVPSTAFSPNGDGSNDAWYIEGIENFPNSSVQLFNRWGNQVLEVIGYQNDWEGVSEGKRNFLGREKVPVGAYYYIIDLKDERTAPVKGWLYINH